MEVPAPEIARCLPRLRRANRPLNAPRAAGTTNGSMAATCSGRPSTRCTRRCSAAPRSSPQRRRGCRTASRSRRRGAARSQSRARPCAARSRCWRTASARARRAWFASPLRRPGSRRRQGHARGARRGAAREGGGERERGREAEETRSPWSTEPATGGTCASTCEEPGLLARLRRQEGREATERQPRCGPQTPGKVGRALRWSRRAQRRQRGT